MRFGDVAAAKSRAKRLTFVHPATTAAVTLAGMIGALVALTRGVPLEHPIIHSCFLAIGAWNYCWFAATARWTLLDGLCVPEPEARKYDLLFALGAIAWLWTFASGAADVGEPAPSMLIFMLFYLGVLLLAGLVITKATPTKPLRHACIFMALFYLPIGHFWLREILAEIRDGPPRRTVDF